MAEAVQAFKWAGVENDRTIRAKCNQCRAELDRILIMEFGEQWFFRTARLIAFNDPSPPRVLGHQRHQYDGEDGWSVRCKCGSVRRFSWVEPRFVKFLRAAVDRGDSVIFV